MSQIPSMPETIEILHLSPEATLPTRAHADEAEWAEIAAEVDREEASGYPAPRGRTRRQSRSCRGRCQAANGRVGERGPRAREPSLSRRHIDFRKVVVVAICRRQIASELRKHELRAEARGAVEQVGALMTLSGRGGHWVMAPRRE